MALQRCNVGRGWVVRSMSGTWAVWYGPRNEVRAAYEVGKVGEEDGADEQIPRTTRGEEDDACARNSRIVPGQDGYLDDRHAY